MFLVIYYLHPVFYLYIMKKVCPRSTFEITYFYFLFLSIDKAIAACYNT